MRSCLIVLCLILATAALAGPRQGGDAIADATVVDAFPYLDTGTTVGYTDDYDGPCPYWGMTSPDVVYAFTPEQTMPVSIDLCGSDYDTRLWVFDPDLEIVDCNDDYYPQGHPCGSYVSRFDVIELIGGLTYFIVVDGYGGDAGDYDIQVSYSPMIGVERQTWSAVRQLFH